LHARNGGWIAAGGTFVAHGRPKVDSFELAEWEPHADGLGGTLKNVPWRAKSDKN